MRRKLGISIYPDHSDPAQDRAYLELATRHGFERIFMSMLARFGLPARSYYDWMLPNCSGYRAELETGPLALRVFAAVGRAKV